MPASRAASEKDEKLRETPGRSSEKVVNATSSVPKNAARTAAPAALNVLWPDVYSGNGGVTRSGVQPASFSVSARGSRSPPRMAVIGLQKWKVYLQSHDTIAASASAMFSTAKSRAFCSSVRPCCALTSCAITFQWPGGVTVPAPSAQNLAISVSSRVRVALVADPISFVWLYSSAHSWLSSAGGAGGRNWAGLSIANGVTPGHCGKSAAANAGAVGAQAPAPDPGVYATASEEWSPARHARIASATASPHRTPNRSGGPVGRP